MLGIGFIQDLAIILAAAGLAGWVCQRLGITAVVGYLVAGMMVGPYSRLALITQVDRIQLAAQVGLVFLLFAVGMRVSLRRLRRQGWTLGLTVVLSSGGLFYLARLLGALTGLDGTQSLFLAGMLMISSTVIVVHLLQVAGRSHDRAGQMALGISAWEDVVAMVMLTVLTTVVGLGGAGPTGTVLETLGRLGAFVVVAGVLMLLVVPWLLRRLSVTADGELQTLGLAGLLFVLAIVAQRAGFPLAMGAFLLGVVVAETPQRHQVERSFGGASVIFSAVFFVAIGLQVNPWLLWTLGWPIVGLAAFALVARVTVVGGALCLAGYAPRDAGRAALTVTPLGEFSFIIVQLGVIAGVVPERLQALAVGASLLTALASLLLSRHAERLTTAVGSWIPKWLATWAAFYRDWLGRLRARREASRLWRLTGRRFRQVGGEMLLVTGLLIFSERMLAVLEGWVGPDWPVRGATAVWFWLTFSAMLALPLMAIWRNVSALALIFAQASLAGVSRARRAQLVAAVEAALKAVAAVLGMVWLGSLLPVSGSGRWVMVASIAGTALAVVFLRRRLIFWHSELEVELQGAWEAPPEDMGVARRADWMEEHGDWDLRLQDCVVPDLAVVRGLTLADLNLRGRTGCGVAGIDRQGCWISLPGSAEALYPQDRLLLVGTPEQIAAGRADLQRVETAGGEMPEWNLASLEVARVLAGGPAEGRSPRDLELAGRHGVQLVGLGREGIRRLNPKADETLQAGDELLLFGPPEKLASFREWLGAGECSGTADAT
jgi:monovalent cation:H+ antiporter-2, CPA2 family